MTLLRACTMSCIRSTHARYAAFEVGWAWSCMKMSFRFTEEDHQILKSLFICDGEADSYALRVPGDYWLGAWKFRMVSEWGEAGARLYHKLRDGLEPALAAHRASAGKTVSQSQSQELSVTLRRSDEDTDMYTVGKIETCRGHQVASEHRIDWKQLAMEASCPLRTRTPPSLLFIRGHAKFEGQKLANIRSKTQSKKKARKVYTSTAPRLSKEMMGELLRTVAYIAEREEEGTVNYTTLQADFLKPMANKSVLQELGRDFHSYVENRVKTIFDENLSHTDSMSS